MRTESYQPSAEVFASQPRDQYVYQRVSDAEFARRWQKIRGFMEEEGLDVLLIGGGTGTWDRCWTNTRWAVNHVGCQLTNHSYVIFPRQGDPTVLAFPINAWLPARRAREVVEDVRAATDPAAAAVERVRELGATRGTLGIVEIDLSTSIPSRHYNLFTQELPDARLRFVTSPWWWKVRLRRSQEEIAFLERAAEIGDAMSAAVEREAVPGLHERDLFALLNAVMIRQGGEVPTMVLAASGSMHRPFDTFQRERHLERYLGHGDVLLTEVAPRLPDGSECQTGRTYTFGEPTPEYEELSRLMVEAFHAVVDQLRPGKTDEDVRRAASFVREAGYYFLSPLIHGAEGGGVGAPPRVAGLVKQPQDSSFTFHEDMVVCVEMHVGKPDHSASVFMADTVLTTLGAPRRLNKYRPELIVL